ncbi:hypothetical protein MB901379_02685 [Mycobacterium basiliense]|uniref:Uncharacterized protein n=1 Tax=Mycobacterium basiliense TaxID=2094119 RepID=A0A447GF82_9MYCO|nr:hypothetical protein [Mycobacterium basiliense]VDM89118.1 hypothetical protein MB901379_02685 [Mycobacterium basiliense]
MGWFQRARKSTAGQRITRADRRRTSDLLAELNAIDTGRERLAREGLAGVATIVAIHRDVATTTLGTWHEFELDVQLPRRAAYRTTRRIAIELSTAPHLTIGAQVPVRVDPRDRSQILVVARL